MRVSNSGRHGYVLVSVGRFKALGRIKNRATTKKALAMDLRNHSLTKQLSLCATECLFVGRGGRPSAVVFCLADSTQPAFECVEPNVSTTILEKIGLGPFGYKW